MGFVADPPGQYPVFPNDAQGAKLNQGDIDPSTLDAKTRANAPIIVPRAGSRFVPDMDLPATQVAPPQPKAAPAPAPSPGDDFEGQMGESSPTGRQVGILGRGAAQGLAQTADAALTNPVITWIKHELGLPEDTYDQMANKALDKAGVPKADTIGERALQSTAGIISSTLATGGVSGAGLKRPPLQAADYNGWASVNGSVNQDVLGTLVGREMGLDANTKMTPTALNAIGKQIRGFLDVVRDPERTIIVDPSNTAGTIAALNRKFTPNSDALMDHPVIKDLMDAVDNGHTNGAALGQISSNLGSAASKIRGDSYQLSKALDGVKDHVETLVKDGLPAPVQQSYDQARKRYGLFAELRDNTLNAATGEINTPKLTRYFKMTDPIGYSEGVNTSPLYQVLRKSEGMAGTPLDATAPIHSKTLAVARAAAATVPGGAQYVIQNGLKPALRKFVNVPGFAAQLGRELNSGDPNGVQSSPDNTP